MDFEPGLDDTGQESCEEDQLHHQDDDTASEASAVQSFREDLMDKQLFVGKLFYTVFMASQAFVMPFLPVFFKIKGMSAADNGLLGALRPLVNFWSGPLWSGLADKLQRRKLIQLICIVLYSFLIFGVWFVPSPGDSSCQDEGGCAPGGHGPTHYTSLPTDPLSSPSTPPDFSEEANSSSLWPTSTSPLPVSTMSTANSTGTGSPVQDRHGHAKTFALLAVLVGFSEMFGAPALGLSDTMVLEMLGPKRLSQFGRQRLWGAVGYGIANLAAGFGASSLADACGRGNYTVHFVGFSILAAISVAVLTRFKEARAKPGEDTGTVTKKKADIRIGRGLRLALFNARAIVFLVTIFFLSISMAILDNFLFWFLTELCASELLLGLSVLCMCASEVPLFIISGWAIRKFGHAAVLVFVFVCYGLRFLAYSLLRNAWWVLPIEPLHGVTFALMWSCSVSYAKKIAPPNLEATLQGVLNAVFWGVGRATGAVLGGFLYNRYGARWLFRTASMAAFGLGFLYVLVEVAIRKHERRQRRRRGEGCVPLVSEMELGDVGERDADSPNGKRSGNGQLPGNGDVARHDPQTCGVNLDESHEDEVREDLNTETAL